MGSLHPLAKQSNAPRVRIPPRETFMPHLLRCRLVNWSRPGAHRRRPGGKLSGAGQVRVSFR